MYPRHPRKLIERHVFDVRRRRHRIRRVQDRRRRREHLARDAGSVGRSLKIVSQHQPVYVGHRVALSIAARIRPISSPTASQ
jgi:hypothetical protein